MVLRCQVPASPGVTTAWEVVERRQRAVAESYQLISQPDHAALAGALAAKFVSPDFPALDAGMVRAIAEHDIGWAIFEPEADPAAPPWVDASGKPVSFVELAPAEFVRAWRASIDHAEQIGAAGGIVVSAHFRRLCRHRLQAGGDSDADIAVLRRFDEDEAGRQHRLRPLASASEEELAALLEVLQFCDLLSLYLCCGAREEVEFPQNFAAGKVRVWCEGEGVRLRPSPFQGKRASVEVNATGYERGSGRGNVSVLRFDVG